MVTGITNVRIFDGEEVISERTVVLNGGLITAVGGPIPADAAIVDGGGGTLLPGLIDSHVHTDLTGLHDALAFGVTTELEMQGHWAAKKRREVSDRQDVADLRTSQMGVTAKGGHPRQYIAASRNPLVRILAKAPFIFPSVANPDEATRFVNQQVKRGADYIKIFIEDGSHIGYPGLPVLDEPTLRAAIDTAHAHHKLVVAHATTADGARQAVSYGADGLAHLFLNAPTPGLIETIAASGAFVIPTLVTLSSAFGNNAQALAADPRVSARLTTEWRESLRRSMNVHPEGRIEDAYATVDALRGAGVDILAGSDVSKPMPMLGGLAHGASLHMELQLLVQAGFTALDALRAATYVPARVFGLADRGRIDAGARADVVLVDGDPTADISATLSTRAVWRAGVQQTPTYARPPR